VAHARDRTQGDGDGHILLPPQAPFAQHPVGDVAVRRINQKLVHPANTTVGRLNARSAMHCYFARRDILVLDCPYFRIGADIRPEHVKGAVEQVGGAVAPD